MTPQDQSTNGGDRTKCWQCGYNRLTFEACPECGAFGGGDSE